jgi:hypothetical protein
MYGTVLKIVCIPADKILYLYALMEDKRDAFNQEWKNNYND